MPSQLLLLLLLRRCRYRSSSRQSTTRWSSSGIASSPPSLRRSGVVALAPSCEGGRGGAMGISLARHPTAPPAIPFGDVHLSALPQAITIVVTTWTF
ncbi:hypothetical protein H4582DRAFT_1967194, partial [Lactarius indigo]